MEYKADDAETAKRLSLIKRKWVMDTNPKCTRNISLRGYPDYPWITVDSDEESFHLQMVTRFILGSHPDWPNYRVATKKWSKRRLDQVFQRALLESSFKKEFDDSMDREVGKIEDQIAVMVQKEEASWRGKDNNPLRIKHKK
ncbi:MAG: hypothetical protein Q7S10_02650 [bacterium]|nr:hypothetical protein [bacterium]